MRILGLLAVLIVIVIIAVCAIAATKPSSFTVSRSTVIAAPPEKIAPLIDDFHNFHTWSPWQDLDPNMHTEISGAPYGPGAIYYWRGNSKAGEGRMTILTATPTAIHGQLDFIKPFAARNYDDFILTPVAGTATPTTQVTWSMTGPMPFMAKVMCVFKNMDAMIGPDFDKGLARMKAVAEK